MPQAWVCVSPCLYGHATPPFDTGRVIAYVRVWYPPPHVLEHVPQAPQLPTQLPASEP